MKTARVSLGYDDAARTQTMSDGAGTQTTQLDGFGRVSSVTCPGHSSISYTRDAAGAVASLAVVGGDTTSWTRDDDGRISSVASDSRSTSYDRDLAGRISSITHQASAGHDPVIEQRTYDDAGDVVGMHRAAGAAVLANVVVTRDAVGRPLQIGRGSGNVTTYSYDSLGRLTQECGLAPCDGPSGTSTNYRYDLNGNRVEQATAAGVVAHFAYDADDALVGKRLGSAVRENYTYNARGELTKSSDARYWYDQAGRVIASGATGPDTTYTYDGMGTRLSETTSAGTTRLVCDTQAQHVPQLVAELDDATGTVERGYAYGAEGLSLLHTPSSSFDYQHDPLVGSIDSLTDATGVAAQQYNYDAFGQDTGHAGTITQPYQYAGERLNRDGDSYHLRARDYVPADGMFTSRDPLEQVTEIPYGYANGNPVTYVDPLGLLSWNSVGAFVGGMAGGTAGLVVGTTCVASGICEVAAGAVLLGAATGYVLGGLTPTPQVNVTVPNPFNRGNPPPAYNTPENHALDVAPADGLCTYPGAGASGTRSHDAAAVNCNTENPKFETPSGKGDNPVHDAQAGADALPPPTSPSGNGGAAPPNSPYFRPPNYRPRPGGVNRLNPPFGY